MSKNSLKPLQHKVPGKKRGGSRRKGGSYDLEALAIGGQRRIPVDELTCGWRSFQQHVSLMGKRLGCKFRTMRDDDGSFICRREA